MSLCQAIAEAVAEHAGGATVRRVDVRIGHLRQVVPDALTFSWGLLTASTSLDGAELVIEQVAATLSCGDCAAVTELDLPILVCGSCGSHTVTLLTGEEFGIVSYHLAEVSDGSVPPAPGRNDP